MIATTQQNMTTELELGGTDGPPRNWKGIGIAVMVILAVMSLVILSVVMLTPDESLLLRHSLFTVDDLEGEEFKVHDPSVAWLSDNEVALRTREGHILTFDFNNNLTTILLDNTSLELSATRFQVSADKSAVLLAYDIRAVFSQSFTASYATYSVATGDLLELRPPQKEEAGLQYAAWGPQGSQLVLFSEGNIFYQPSVSSQALRLTSTGDPHRHRVVNGLSDWTYEEEVLLSYVAHWWSADGARLAYLSINNSATPLVEIPKFLGGLYPSNAIFPYPKAGSNIPSVSLLVVNLYGPAHTVEMTPPDSVRTSREGYISMVTWTSSTRLAVRWLNRAQNQSVLCVCEATTGACSEKHKVSLDKMPRPSQDVPLFSEDGAMFYAVLPAKQGARGEFSHVAALPARPTNPSIPARFLTSGSWDVTSLCALDDKAGKIYFLSTEESKQRRHLYSVDVDGAFERQCITCHLLDECHFFDALFSPNRTHVALRCLGPGIPKVTVHSIQDPYRYVVLEDNSPLSKALEDKHLPETLFRTFSTDSHDVHLKLSLPRGYEANLHPLLVIVDGLPGRESVTEEFSLGWPQVLSGVHGVALAWVDSRSGAGRGQKVATAASKLGLLHVRDHLEVVEFLRKLPYIDDRRMALYGKAFGGYLTLKMLTATEKLFQCAAAVAPITDFRLYNAAFSERYLGLPTKEEHVYSTASLLEDVNKLKDENFLILHGTADAKVHFQHSAELLSRLVRVEANYSLQLYPDEGHTLREPRSVQHFQRTVLNYFHNCFKHRVLLDTTEDEEEDDD
ncbi:inactive dipeptidyl peptidase 10 isoform X1 [Entelurus aequoreus]|uniref:inactive dipeptidyl peptidase 10 isoform X1 n=1 Tax=Entelurus aequoreus TaxID=161455 RepID=UPI002B1D4594|nr:inactive dipeptidyl peptidase 10 isoform X1 [Entelurus aequoreus]